MTRSMTAGSPVKHIISFSIPLYGGMLFQQLYNLVDTAIVGRLLGASALAAVGSTSSIIFMIVGFCMGICAGFSIPIAQSFGAGDAKRMRCFAGTSLWLASGIALLLTAVTMLLCRRILRWINTPDDIIDQAYNYLIVIFAAIPTTILYNLTSGYLRSLGDSRTSFYFLLLSSVINVVLDYSLIRYFAFGVEGAAWATLISQLISGAGCLVYIVIHCDMLQLRLSKDDMHFRGDYAGKLCYAGVPMGLQYTVTAIGSVILQSFLNGLGTACVAAAAAATKIHSLAATPFDALGSTMATYCGQNVGAGKYSRLGRGIAAAGMTGCIYSVLIFLTMTQVSGKLVLLFLDVSETEIIRMSSQYILITCAFYIALTFVNVVRFSIQGMGFSVLAILAGVMELIARAIAGIILVPALGYTGACLGSPLAWLMADAFLFPACVLCIRRLKKQGPTESQETEQGTKLRNA